MSFFHVQKRNKQRGVRRHSRNVNAKRFKPETRDDVTRNSGEREEKEESFEIIQHQLFATVLIAIRHHHRRGSSANCQMNSAN